MKRSNNLKLVLMASTAVLASGCSEEAAPGGAYSKVEECVKGGEFTEAECQQSYDAALKIHEQSAPRYQGRNLCEEQHGLNNCNSVGSSSSNVWMPFFAGYFVSKFLASNGNSCQSQLWQSCTRPFYPSASGGYYTSSGHSLFRDRSSGKPAMYESVAKTKPVRAKVQTRTTVAARGGFGSRLSSSGSRGG